MKHIIYFLSAIFLLIIVFPIAIISIVYRYVFKTSSARKTFNDFLLTVALSIDAFGNVLLSNLFNHILITEEGYPYGDWHETISQVTGENEIMNTLTPLGRKFRNLLDWIFGKNHCRNSVKYKEIRCKRYLHRINMIEEDN